MFQNQFLILGACLAQLVLVQSEGSGLLTAISQRQRSLLKHFRGRILESGTTTRDYQISDGYLIRWLIAKEWDIDLAAQFFYEALKWRKDEEIDSILNEILEFPVPPFMISGVDNEGRPVLTTSILDLRSLILQGKKDKLLSYQVQALEKLELTLRELSMTTGKDVHQGVSVNDYAGFNFRQHACPICIDVILRGLRNQRNFYPGLFKFEVLLNVPRIAETILDLPSYHHQLLNETSPIRAFGTNKPEWSKFLKSIIPVDQLSTKFGGTNV